MPMFKIMSFLGLSGTEIKTQLDDSNLVLGGEVKGKIYVKGGSTKQNIDSIYIFIATEYLHKSPRGTNKKEAVCERIKLTEPFIIKSKEERVIPFSFQLPHSIPITSGNVPVWFKTGLKIKNTPDPTDEDYVNVLPNEEMKTIFECVEELGFIFDNCDCKYSRHLGPTGNNVPFVQEFEFKPIKEYRDVLNDLELMIFFKGGKIKIFIEMNRRAFFDDSKNDKRDFLEFELENLHMRKSEIKQHFQEIISKHTY